MDTRKENLIVNLSTAFAVKVIAFHYEIKRTGIDSMQNIGYSSARNRHCCPIRETSFVSNEMG